MELALATFMTSIGFTFAEVLKMLTLVALNFVFMGAYNRPIIFTYSTQ